MTDFPSESVKPLTRARIFSALTLLGLAVAVGAVAREAYRAATDAFVAPIILSTENELVLQAKAKASEIEVDRERSAAELQALEADILTGEALLGRLAHLEASTKGSLEWTKLVLTQKAMSSAAELRELARERTMLDTTDRATAFEIERARRESEASLSGAWVAQRALVGDGAPLLPEAVMREERLVRIALEAGRIESDLRGKRAAKKVLVAKLAKMDELEQQFKARPLYRATQGSLDVAFVPYTQEEGVTPGAKVYRCTWGLFHCRPVGAIAEVVPGEVMLPDPWGTPARGRYAVLALDDRDSAKSKVLRVRGGHASERVVVAAR